MANFPYKTCLQGITAAAFIIFERTFILMSATTIPYKRIIGGIGHSFGRECEFNKGYIRLN